MNHPLPQSATKSSMAYEFVKAITEEPAVVSKHQAQPAPDAAVPEQDALHPAAAQGSQEVAPMTPDANDAYEAYRQRMLAYQSEQDDIGHRPVPQPASRALSSNDIERLRQREYFYDPAQYYARAIDQQTTAEKPPVPFFRSSLFSRGLAAAAATAIVAGCGVGIALTKQDDIRNTAHRTLAYVGALLPDDQPTRAVEPVPAKPVPAATVIAKKPIATATVDVRDVVGAPNSTIPLALRADPSLDGKDITFRISGLPEHAMLTAGHRQDNRTWMLSDEDLANVGLVVPDASTPTFELSVAAIETATGELASPIREMTVALSPALSSAPQPVEPAPVRETVVQQVVAEPVPAAPQAAEPAEVSISPASAAAELQGAAVKPPEVQAMPVPAPVATPAPVVSPEAQALLQKGDVLLRNGDLVMARQFYLRAVDLGAPQGALGVAKTYDPAVFKELGVQGIMPDAAQAEQWYRKASAAGLTDAIQALTRFNTTAALPAQ